MIAGGSMSSSEVPEADQFIKELITASQEKNFLRLESLTNGTFSINQRDSKECNAAIYLGKINDFASFYTLKRFGAKFRDFIYGVALGGHEHDLNHYIKLADSRRVQLNFNKIAAYFALGGYIECAEKYLVNPRNITPDYNEIAGFFAMSGLQEYTERYLTDPRNTSPDFNKAAQGAAMTNHESIAKKFLEDPRNTSPDYNSAAAVAAIGRHLVLAEKLLTDPKNLTPDYNTVACLALAAGHRDIAERFYKDPKNINSCEKQIIEQARIMSLAIVVFESDSEKNPAYKTLDDAMKVVLSGKLTRQQSFVSASSSCYTPSLNKEIQLLRLMEEKRRLDSKIDDIKGQIAPHCARP